MVPCGQGLGVVSNAGGRLILAADGFGGGLGRRCIKGCIWLVWRIGISKWDGYEVGGQLVCAADYFGVV